VNIIGYPSKTGEKSKDKWWQCINYSIKVQKHF